MLPQKLFGFTDIYSDTQGTRPGCEDADPADIFQILKPAGHLFKVRGHESVLFFDALFVKWVEGKCVVVQKRSHGSFSDLRVVNGERIVPLRVAVRDLVRLPDREPFPFIEDTGGVHVAGDIADLDLLNIGVRPL